MLRPSSFKRCPGSHTDTSRNSTKSIKSQIPEPMLEHGRYYANATYFMPCDDNEQTRLAVMDQIYLSMLDNQLSLGRISPTADRILDLGTGIGDWAVAVAERFPNAEVTATDISSVSLPPVAPGNVTFELDDAQKEWTYNKPFDFIHIRGLAGSFSDWDEIYAEASRHLKISGTLEVSDQGSIQLTNEPANSFISIYNGALLSAAEKAKTPIGLDHLKKPAFDKAGLSIVKSKTLELPIGPWSQNERKKLAGRMALIAMMEGLEAYALRILTKYQEWKEEDVRQLIGKVKQEIITPDSKPFVKVQFVVARKLGI